MRVNPVRKAFAFLSPAILVAGLIFFSFRAASANDAFVTASIAEPVNLIPFFATDSASAEISQLIFNGLLKYDKDLRLVGDLAENWEVLEGGLRIRFHLKQGVLWQDGRPFTAADVEFTYQKLTDSSAPTPYGGDFEKIRSLDVKDAFTVDVLYKEAFSPGLSSWTMGIIPKHLLEKENMLTTAFARNPVGTGPYALLKWKSGEKIELQANKRYFKGAPVISRYVYRIIPDQSTLFLELQTENLDFASLTPLQYSRQTKTTFFQKKYVKYRYPAFAYVYVGYNLEHPLFLDKRVRKAVGMAIDKKEIVDVTLMGLGKVSTGPFLPGTWAYDASVPPQASDPGRAARLLTEAGWSDTDGDGIRDKHGKKLSFTLITNQGNDARKMACEIIQKRLAEVGVDMRIQVVEWGAFLKEFIDKKRFDAVLLAWQLSRDPDPYDIFHSANTAPGKFNFVSYRNAEVDKLIERGRTAFGESERANVYHRIHGILNEDEPYTFLYVPDALPIVHRRFKNIEVSPAGLGHNFIRWFVPPAETRYRVEEDA